MEKTHHLCRPPMFFPLKKKGDKQSSVQNPYMTVHRNTDLEFFFGILISCFSILPHIVLVEKNAPKKQTPNKGFWRDNFSRTKNAFQDDSRPDDNNFTWDKWIPPKKKCLTSTANMKIFSKTLKTPRFSRSSARSHHGIIQAAVTSQWASYGGYTPWKWTAGT